jgi:hypothetical protein
MEVLLGADELQLRVVGDGFVLGLAEGEGAGRNARVEQGDLEGAVGDGAELADELV